MKKILFYFSILVGVQLLSSHVYSQKVYVISSNAEDGVIPETNKLKVYVTGDTLFFDVSVFFVTTVGGIASNKTDYNEGAVWATMPDENSGCISIKYVNTREEADIVIYLAANANSAWWASEEKKTLFNSKKKTNCN